MKNISEKLEQITKESEADKAKLEQLSKFEDTLKNLQKLIFLDKPTFIFPQVDTIGKHTFTSLNKK